MIVKWHEKCYTDTKVRILNSNFKKRGKEASNMSKFDMFNKDTAVKVEEFINLSRLSELLRKKEQEEKKKNCILWILAIIGTIAAVAAIAYAVYRFFTPDYLDDFEDDFEDEFEDEFDDDFFDDDDFEPAPKEEKEVVEEAAAVTETEETAEITEEV